MSAETPRCAITHAIVVGESRPWAGRTRTDDPVTALRRVLVWTLGSLFALAALWLVWIGARVLWYGFEPPRETAFMAHRVGEARAKGRKLEPKYVWVPYARIAAPLKRAMIAAEDAKFVDHEGFDWDGIQVALEKNQKRGRVVAGGSTITQQLAKNLFLSPAKSYWRKGEELRSE